MNEKIMKVEGFEKEVNLVRKGRCPFCKSEKTKRKDFRDELSWKDYNISGLCQKCMDKLFGRNI